MKLIINGKDIKNRIIDDEAILEELGAEVSAEFIKTEEGVELLAVNNDDVPTAEELIEELEEAGLEGTVELIIVGAPSAEDLIEEVESSDEYNQGDNLEALKEFLGEGEKPASKEEPTGDSVRPRFKKKRGAEVKDDTKGAEALNEAAKVLNGKYEKSGRNVKKGEEEVYFITSGSVGGKNGKDLILNKGTSTIGKWKWSAEELATLTVKDVLAEVEDEVKELLSKSEVGDDVYFEEHQTGGKDPDDRGLDYYKALIGRTLYPFTTDEGNFDDSEVEDIEKAYYKDRRGGRTYYDVYFRTPNGTLEYAALSAKVLNIVLSGKTADREGVYIGSYPWQ